MGVVYAIPTMVPRPTARTKMWTIAPRGPAIFTPLLLSTGVPGFPREDAGRGAAQEDDGQASKWSATACSKVSPSDLSARSRNEFSTAKVIVPVSER